MSYGARLVATYKSGRELEAKEHSIFEYIAYRSSKGFLLFKFINASEMAYAIELNDLKE